MLSTYKTSILSLCKFPPPSTSAPGRQEHEQSIKMLEWKKEKKYMNNVTPTLAREGDTNGAAISP